MSEASYKKFQLYCNNCHWKRLTDGGDIKDLYEIKTSPVPTGIPIFDPETKKIITPKPQSQKRKFRCPTCGFAIVPRVVPDYQKEADAKLEIQDRALKRKELEEKILKDRNRRSNEEDRIDGSEAGAEGRAIQRPDSFGNEG
jgi:DNA-directed RNA polymerase subunit RPC12/RpoP